MQRTSLRRASRVLAVLPALVLPALVLALPAAAQKGPAPGQEPAPRKEPAPTTGQIEVPADHHAGSGREVVKLYFERFGGPGGGRRAAIALHGGPGAAAPFGKILAGSEPGRLVLKRYDLVYFHQRGSGRSLLTDEARPEFVIKNRARYSMDQYVEDLELVRRKFFGPRGKVTLVGSSWGGFLGLAYALKYQRHVDGLILGSFEASAYSGTDFCRHIDQTLLAAEAEIPELRAALGAWRAAAVKKQIIWHRGRKDQRVLQRTDLIELALPFMFKAKFAALAELLGKLARKDAGAQRALDGLRLDETSTAGASLPGAASYCRELFVRARLETDAATATPALYADCGKIARGFVKLCSPYLDDGRRHFDVEQKLGDLRVPAILFAGTWDPVIPWQATARTAAKMPRAAFLLIKGGHTPFDEGGACLSGAIERLASGRQPEGRRCF